VGNFASSAETYRDCLHVFVVLFDSVRWLLDRLSQHGATAPSLERDGVSKDSAALLNLVAVAAPHDNLKVHLV
jgi:hypothetical protein